jgi:hypothetical protein
MRPTLRLTVLAAVCCAALPAPAGAAIVPQEGLRGVKLGMTVAEIRAALGSPDRFRTVRSEMAGPVREWRYGLTRITFDSTAPDATVLELSTSSRTERTPEGVGVGSKRATVRTKVPGVRCLVEFSYDHCFVGRWRAGEVVTDFAIDRRGRVSRVTVGRILD